MSESKVYEVFARMGDCMICDKYKDLRAGACYQCQGKVTGEPFKNGHKLWEIENPKNYWYYGG